MPSKCQNVKVTGLKAFKKCPILWSHLVEMSDVRQNWDGVVTGLLGIILGLRLLGLGLEKE